MLSNALVSVGVDEAEAVAEGAATAVKLLLLPEIAVLVFPSGRPKSIF